MNFDLLTEFLESIPEKFGAPSGDLIVYKDHKPVYRHFFGYANREEGKKIVGNEFYRLYSCSKVSTCVAAMKLIDEGRLSLDDKLSDYLPEYETMYVNKRDADGNTVRVKAENPILIRHLFQMTAGFNYDCGSKEICEVREKTEGRCENLEVSKGIAKMTLQFEPGTRFSYSLCHDVLAFVVEKVSGMRFSEYMKKNIFLPLGMNETGYKVTKEILPRFARRYMRQSDTNTSVLIDPDTNWFELGTEYESGGAGVVSTVNDYIKLAEMLCRGGVTETGERIISREAIETMRTTVLSPEQLDDYNQFPHGYRYALGVRTHYDTDNKDSLSGKYEFGWDGAAAAYIEIDIENRVSIYFGCSTMNMPLWDVHSVIRNLVHKALGDDK